MVAATPKDASRCDEALMLIADYVDSFTIETDNTYDTARLCLRDSIGCAILALKFPECRKLLGPIVPGTVVPDGARVPGTDFVMDPIRAAFNFGTMIRWLDFNDTFLAAEWGHPSDNIGGILTVCDFVSRQRRSKGEMPLSIRDVLTAIIKAHEIQGGLALCNSFNRIGFDHVILVKIATTAVATNLLGGSRQQVADAVSNAWVDVGPLRCYRHAPNTGSRKSWAAGDATSRGVQLALMTMKGEMGYPTALTAERWGFYDVLRDGRPFEFERPLGTYVMDNVLFKVSFPAEFHAQTAVEAALRLHSEVNSRLHEIESVTIKTQEPAVRIIDKSGTLHNPADRDHCIQYMVAIALIFGELTADHYEDECAADSRIDLLRSKMHVEEDTQYSKDYLDPKKRSIANAVTVKYNDGTHSDTVAVEYPIGHQRRRNEALPLLKAKFVDTMKPLFDKGEVEFLLDLFNDPSRLDTLTVPDLLDLLIRSPQKY